MDDESHRFKTNTIITLDDGTHLTVCTQPPRHPPQRTSPWVRGGCAQSP
jgi:hypothetical protein